MKFLSVLLSLCLCFSLLAFAAPMPENGERPQMPEGGFQPPEGGNFQFNGEMPPMPEGGNFQFDGERPQRGPQNNAQPPSVSTQKPAVQETAPEESKKQERPQFPGMGEGGNPWDQNSQNMAGQNGFAEIWAKYSNIIISLGVLIVAFVFVGLYRRRHY